MRASVAVLVAVLALLVAPAAPGVLAHGDDGHDTSDGSGDGDSGDGSGSHPSENVSHPHKRGYDTFRGREFWGEITRIPDDGSSPRDPAISSGWIVWVSPGFNVYAYNLTREIQVQITSDDRRERSPAVHGSRIVWVEEDAGTYRTRLYDLDAGTNRVLDESNKPIKNPAISSDWVVWAYETSGGSGSSKATWNLRAYDLDREETTPVATGPAMDYKPAIHGDHVAWLQRQYSQWDVWVRNLSSGESSRVTANVNEESQLRSGPQGFFYLMKHRRASGHHAYRYVPSTDEIVNLGYDAPGGDLGALPGPRGQVVQRGYVVNSSLSYRLPETGDSHTLHTGRLDIKDIAGPANRTLAMVVDVGGERVLVAYQFSRLATYPVPEVKIENPTEGTVVSNETTVRGRVDLGENWPGPLKVYIAHDSGDRWHEAVGTTQWQGTLDFTDAPTGRESIRVAAEFPGAPPETENVRVLVGQPLDFTQDLSPNFESQSKDLVTAILDTIPLLIVLVLALAALLLLLARTYLRWVRKNHPQVRYVPPDEPSPPNENPADAADPSGEESDRRAGS